MNKLIAILCIMVLMLSATGCGQTAETSMEQLLSEELSGEITVSCYDTMRYKATLETAAKSFEEKNPGTKINIETFSPMPEIKTSGGKGSTTAIMKIEEDAQQKTEYISKINTELMSGEGADLLAMDILPYYKYADGGQLEDLQKYMEADSSFHKDEYRTNIIDALKYKDSQYVMPMDYTFNYIAYDTSLFSEEEQQAFQNVNTLTYEQLIKSAEEPFRRANTDPNSPIRLFGAPAYSTQQGNLAREVFRQDYNSFIDMENRKANMTDGRFTALLESLKTYDSNGYLMPSSDLSGSKEFSIEDFAKQREERFFYKIKNYFTFLTEALEQAGLRTMISFGNMAAGNEENDEELGLLTNDSGEVSFTYTQAYGINANSDNKALAWSFLKHLMSEEVQASVDMGRFGLPVNNAARLEKAKMDITGTSFQRANAGIAMKQSGGKAVPQEGEIQGQNTDNAELTESQQSALDQYVKNIETLSELLNYCQIEDEFINKMLNDEAANYFDGSKTADEVAETLEKKIELYLNE